MSNFKKGNDLWLATVAWLFHYEFPAAQYRDYNSARGRYANSLEAYKFLVGVEPDPDPPVEPPVDPPVDPPDPEPQPWEFKKHMPVYMYHGVRMIK